MGVVLNHIRGKYRIIITSVEPPPDTKEKQDDEKENNPFRVSTTFCFRENSNFKLTADRLAVIQVYLNIE